MSTKIGSMQLTHNRLTDEELVERFRNGDKNSLDVLIRAYLPRTYKTVLRLVPELDAADVRQDIFLSSIESIGNFKSGTNFAAWLTSITKRRIADYYRQASRRRGHPVEDQRVEVDDTWRSIDDELTLRNALAQMPQGHRRLLSLIFMEGLSLGEISDKIGLTYEATRSRYRRAIAMLKDKIVGNQTS